MLASELNTFLEGIAASDEAVAPALMEDLIAEGESDELEFKSSLRWDYKQEAVNKRLEDVVVKSIAAFGNGQGGTLLIGVNDVGTPLGLEHDYTTLGGGNVFVANILGRRTNAHLYCFRGRLDRFPVTTLCHLQAVR